MSVSTDFFVSIIAKSWNTTRQMRDFFESFSFALVDLNSTRLVNELSTVTGKDSYKVRFNICDLVCKGRMKPFIENYMRQQTGVYDMSLFEEFCGIFENKNARFDIGIQWGADEDFPAIKIYYGESQILSDYFNDLKGKKRIMDLFAIKRMPEYVPCTICVDFVPGMNYDLKTYFKSEKVPVDLPNGFKFPSNYAEPPCYYYEMDCLISGRKKHYMEYPTETANNPLPDLYEIIHIFSKIGAVDNLRIIRNWIREAAVFSCKPVPTLLSVSDRNVFSFYCGFMDKHITLRGRKAENSRLRIAE